MIESLSDERSSFGLIMPSECMIRKCLVPQHFRYQKAIRGDSKLLFEAEIAKYGLRTVVIRNNDLGEKQIGRSREEYADDWLNGSFGVKRTRIAGTSYL